MRKPNVWIEAGIVIIYGASLDAAVHSHHAIQVIWPKCHSLCKLNNKDISELVIVDSNIEHQLQMSEGWILLVEPKSTLGQALADKLAGESYKTFHSSFSATVKPQTQAEELTGFLTPLLQALELAPQVLLVNKSTVADKRIQQLLTELNRCLQGDCIKPANWRAAEVAGQLALSQSRFLHLFREELGIAWRPYLLWRRMMCALRAILNNASATEAAHLAGFSDSAHLSRTFRNSFGMTIRQAQALFIKT
ncbi:helix-turn-helix transcriptional regulator [Thalassomonas haliotis]|uniref:Helix-turn-helix transcriptional regulator n=1 Tax=Thalassomonas haliotis TaxID=485448 RepID=A0ABY7VDZ9_9GAMM|nr:helix-turn-helix transcriptional regulator [Thalassomonas haliotis]WDE11773.1 helix-turn-helix transcriptional regulator [Thalassomonas haliotis]